MTTFDADAALNSADEIGTLAKQLYADIENAEAKIDKLEDEVANLETRIAELERELEAANDEA